MIATVEEVKSTVHRLCRFKYVELQHDAVDEGKLSMEIDQ
jgi:hypothetical protein